MALQKIVQNSKLFLIEEVIFRQLFYDMMDFATVLGLKYLWLTSQFCFLKWFIDLIKINL